MPFINEVVENNREKIEQQKKTSRKKIASRFSFDPDKVIAHLRSEIVGQDQSIDTISDLLQIIKADISDVEKPLGVCFLAGSTGVGKTQTVKALAKAINGDAGTLCRIDMNTLAQEHYAASLTGAPPGYVGSKEGNTLFDVEKIQGSYSRPGIVLFDEIEKADDVIKKALLNVMDCGFLQLAAGNKSIDFRNTIIFFTSNLGSQQVRSYEEKYLKGWRRWLGLKIDTDKYFPIFQKAISSHFVPEFINRIDYILVYNHLGQSFLPELLDIEISKLNQRLAKKDLFITVEQSAKNHLLSYYEIQYGARFFIRRIRQVLNPVLAKKINDNLDAKHLIVRYQQGSMTINSAENS